MRFQVFPEVPGKKLRIAGGYAGGGFMGQHIQGASRRRGRQGQYGDGILLLKAVGGGGGHDGPVIPCFQKSGENGNAGGSYKRAGLGIDVTVMPQPEFRSPSHIAVEPGSCKQFLIRRKGGRVDRGMVFTAFAKCGLSFWHDQHHVIFHNGNHVHMGTAGMVKGKADVSLFAAHQGVDHVGGIAFDVQGKSVG